MILEDKLYTTQEVAALLRVKPLTIRRWIGKKRLQSYKIGSRGKHLFKKEDIQKLMGL